MTILRLTLDGVTHDLEFDSWRLSEADQLIKFTGWSRNEWIDALFNDHPDAIRFAWLIVNQRNGTPLDVAFKDIDFDLALFRVEIVRDDESEEVAEGADLPTSPAASSVGEDSATT